VWMLSQFSLRGEIAKTILKVLPQSLVPAAVSSMGYRLHHNRLSFYFLFLLFFIINYVLILLLLIDVPFLVHFLISVT
jgi:hypothetical protein